MRSGQSLIRTTAAGVLAVLVVGCGSTFPVEQGAPVAADSAPAGDDAQAANGDSGLSLGPPTSGATVGSDTGSAGSSATAGTSGGAGSTSDSTSTPTSPSSTPSQDDTSTATQETETTADDGPGVRAVAPGQPGIDEQQILVGLTYTEDSNEANSALGAGGITTGDQRRNYDVLLAYFNERGGAHGREIVPVYHKYEATSSQPYAVQEQAACTTFTQDQPVFVSLAGGLQAISDGTFNACMQAAGTPVLAASALSDQNDASFERWPDFVQVPTLSLDAIARVWPAGLDERGYFEPRTPAGETLIGLLSYDTQVMKSTADRSLKPALAALDHEVEVEEYVRQPDSFSDVSDMSAEIQSAVLQFRSAGVEHILIQDAGNALLTLLFMNSAESQGYRPRYGLTTNNGGQILVGSAPEAQFAEARMVGWLPDVDVPPSSFDEPMGRGRELCDAIYADAGITFANSNAALVAYGQCDQFRSLLAAVGASSGPMSQETFIDDFTSIGTGFESAIVGPTRFGPQRHYGVARSRLAEFSEDCGCFQYTTPWREVP